MAFVFREERKFDNRPMSSIGPGEYYLPPTNAKKIKSNNKCPFESKEKRLKQQINTNPGPGTYYKNEDDIKYRKMLEKSNIVSMNQEETALQREMLAPFDIENPVKIAYRLRDQKEKIGFDIKDKRFKEHINENPGPGNYFPSQPRSISAVPRPNSANNQLITNKLTKHFLLNGNKTHTNILTHNENKVCSIPSKNDNGFEIGSDDQLIKITENSSNNFKMFKGEQCDSVGPGSYQIDSPNIWHKAGPSWSKMRAGRTCSAKTNFTENNFNNTGGFSERPPTAFIFDLRIQSANKNKKYNCARVMSAQREKRMENCRRLRNENKKHNLHGKTDITDVNNNLNENSFLMKQYDRMLNSIKANLPGPGYYIDIDSQSSFKSIPYPENRQFFLSNTERFKSNNLLQNGLSNAPEPGTYFKNLDKKLPKNNPLAPFSVNQKRFMAQNNIVENKNPGPGDYKPKIPSQIGKNHFNDAKTCFNLRQKRFGELDSEVNWKLNTPGPGAYINPYSATGTSNTMLINGLYLDLRKGIELLRPKSSDPKIIKKYDSFTPCVGDYDPEKIYTIAYNVKRKNWKKNGKDIAFNTHVDKKKKKDEVKKENVGPGFYYREKNVEVKQVYPPFHQSDIKLKQNDTLDIGPGTYELSTYFDWNKKTYNGTFI